MVSQKSKTLAKEQTKLPPILWKLAYLPRSVPWHQKSEISRFTQCKHHSIVDTFWITTLLILVSKSTVACCYYCICSPSRFSTGNIRCSPPSPPWWPLSSIADAIRLCPMTPGSEFLDTTAFEGISNGKFKNSWHLKWQRNMRRKNTFLSLRWWKNQRICFWWGECEVIQV